MSKWFIVLVVLAFAGTLWAGQEADEGSDAQPRKEAEQAGPDEETVVVAQRGPRVVPPQEMAQPYESDIPLAGSFSPDALQLKALSPNLVQNGSFEQGRYWPYYWDPVDRMGTLWVEGGSHGKRFIRVNTNIFEGQWLPWNEKILALAKDLSKRTRGRPQSVPSNPLPEPPEIVPPPPGDFNTVGGLHGIHYRSAFFKATPGAVYRFSIDARGQSGGSKVFIKGFIDQRRKTEEGMLVLKRKAWQSQFPLDGISGEWRRFACVCHPARSKSTYMGKPVQPEWYQIQIYAYWPSGIYEYDNVRMDIVGYEEIVHTKENQPEPEKPETEPAEGMDGEFPIF